MNDNITLVTSVMTLVGSLVQLALIVSTLRVTKKVYHATNSMKDELVASVRAASRAEGIKEGKEMG